MAEPAELLVIKDQYELAQQSMNHGSAAQEADNKSEALVYYKKSRLHLRQGLEVPTGGERHQGVVWDKARQLQQKMKEMLGTIDIRLSDLEKSTPGDTRLLSNFSTPLYPDLVINGQPTNSSVLHLYPTIPDTTHSTSPAFISPIFPAVPNTHTLPSADLETVDMDSSTDLPPAYTPKPMDGHRSLVYDPAGGSRWSREPPDGKDLLSIPSGVQLFFVEPNGQVSSLSSPGYLRIITTDNQQSDRNAGKPAGFLHVCDRLYPLSADTPVLLANSGIYMFPDYLAELPSSYVGLVLSSDLPTADCEMFQDVLTQLADLRIQGTEGAEGEVINLTDKIPLNPLHEQTDQMVPEGEKTTFLLPGWSEKMAQGILSGATKLSQSFAKGAEATGNVIQKGAAKIRDRITPEETPTDVSPQVTKGLNATKQATGGAVRVSKFLVNGISTIAEHVAEKVAPHVKKHGAKLVPESLKKSQDGQASNFDGAKFVATSSIRGLSTVWESLETGAKHVCKSVATETVTTVKYKYGNDAGQATDTALRSVGNIGVAAHNIDNLGLKALLKTTGKKTAKVMIKESDDEVKETEENKTQKDKHLTQAEKEVEMKEEATAKKKDVNKEQERRKKE
ncbi:spartin a isoform X1 [Xiphophorus couchianus]|uniref:spartin a isoform X1 n=1 Tax=Xiphophorus couchianus TaxID=32473 RepID=UPI001016B54E|nr:spartin isoform X1 [Xiphophorus couchianus]XP_027887850.1 spartin isoform X1 [Xiphophorus couchianus]XP_027887852.1 spartin isoform X1 [Xiphophorus couchianus]